MKIFILALLIIGSTPIPFYPSRASADDRNPFDYGSIQNTRLAPNMAFSVDAIFIAGNMKVAIIEGRRYKVGDIVADEKIVSITIDKVVTIRNGAKIFHHVEGRGGK